MNKNQVIEAIEKYADKFGLEMTPWEDNLSELIFEEGSRRLFVRYDIAESESNSPASVWFRWIVGEIMDLSACIPLLHFGRWKPSPFYLTAIELDGNHYLCAEAEIYLHKDLSVQMASEILIWGYHIPFSDFKWPDGLTIWD